MDSSEAPRQRTLRVVVDGDFTTTGGIPSSIRSHYDAFARRYTGAFSRVVLYCRVHPVEDARALPLGGSGVEVVPLAPIHGIGGLVRHGPAIWRTFMAIPREDAVLLRVPGIFPSIAWLVVMLRRMPFGVEAMADADAQFARGSFRRFGRSAYRAVWTRLMRWQCRQASAAAYVTREALQRAFPPRPGRPSFSYTTLDLPNSAIVQQPRGFSYDPARPVRLINVAMMHGHLKGQDIIIAAMAELRRRGIRAHLQLVGDGNAFDEFRALVRTQGVEDIVEFCGAARTGGDVFRLLDGADLFVLPSRQEGLPRAVIEAMARGLPCIATDMPGTRELLPPDALVASESAAEWADRLAAAIRSGDALARQSAANLAIARRYAIEPTAAERRRFYDTLATATS